MAVNDSQSGKKPNKPSSSGGTKSTFPQKRPATDPLMLEKALKESEHRFAELVNQLPQTVFEINRDGVITFTNSHGLENFGYTTDELERGITLTELIAPENHAEAMEKFGRTLQGETPFTTEYIAVRKDGSRFPVEVCSSPIIIEGRTIGIRGVVIDLTERKHLEEERRAHEKMQVLSNLASGIVHRMANLLTPIIASFSLASNMIEEEGAVSGTLKGEVLETLKEGERAALKLTALNKQLLGISHGRLLAKEAASVTEIVRENTHLALLGSNVLPVFNFPPEECHSHVDRAQISEVVTNIVTNARHAMPNGGTLTITADIVEHTPKTSGVGKQIRISFKDQGPGIRPEALEHVFEPYFTTKGEFGTGLGMTVSMSIMKKHGGYIKVESVYGEGTTVSIFLPLSEKPVDEAQKNEPAKKRGHGKILLMDDEQAVRKVANRILAGLGYEVACASDGEEALQLFQEARANQTPFNLVILDLTVPGGKGGTWTIEQMRKIDPDVKAIISSGYSQADFPDDVPRLPKPYSITAMSDLVDKIINSGK